MCASRTRMVEAERGRTSRAVVDSEPSAYAGLTTRTRQVDTPNE